MKISHIWAYRTQATTKENHQTTREETKRRKKTEKNYKNNLKTSNKMALSTYLSIITLNVNGLNAPIKRHSMADWIKKNNIHLYAVFKWLISKLKTHTDWKLGDGKRYFMQMEMTGKQG